VKVNQVGLMLLYAMSKYSHKFVLNVTMVLAMEINVFAVLKALQNAEFVIKVNNVEIVV